MATEALNTSSWQFSIYAPDEKPVDMPASRPALVPDDIRPGPGNEQHKDGEPDILNAPLIKSDKVVTVQGDAIQNQWSETITGLMETVSNWSKVEAGKWEVSEVTVGLTLSAEGKLLFIAKGSAEASIEIKLKRSGGSSAPD